ncbi:PIR protein [Plasmodium yoelii yoelii]|uniref:PIR protein n=1 Tax=Plasmodium yoelii yoelii TaxID=73239 RepID=A0AAE9WPD5_PLAYO|nr:PIR protein [Plasmodium yoelii yoelii]
MNILSTYCPNNNCSSDEEKIISGFIILLNTLDAETIDGDKLAEYAILWLSYKLNQKKENGITNLYDFYANNIETNSLYTGNISNNSDDHINKDIIDSKIRSMDIDIKDISNFYDAFKSLCNIYSEINAENNTECKTCLENAGEFFEKCEKVKNVFDITKGSSYLQLWSSLSNDYKNFENNYNTSILLGVSYKYSLFGFRKRSQKQHLREMLKK